MSKRHTKLFGSTSYRTLNCPAHYQRSRNMPEPPTSPAAEEGTFLHAICEAILKQPDMLPEQHPRWDELNFDQQRIVWNHVEYVRDLAKGGRLYVELLTKSPHLHPEWFGTADAVIVKPPRLIIADLKCGRIGVEVEDDKGDVNAQLASYAISVLENLRPAVARQIKEVELVVVQPRNGGFKHRLVSLEELDAMKHRLLEAARLAEDDNPPANIGPWCKFCRAKATCETLRAHVHDQARLDFALVGGTPDKLSPEDLKQVLDMAAIAKDWIAGVETYAMQLLASDGEAVEGWTLEPKRAIRRWAENPTLTALALRNRGLPADKLYRTELRSPAQIEQLAAEEGIEVDLSDLTTAVSSGMKLAKRKDDEDDGGW